MKLGIMNEKEIHAFTAHHCEHAKQMKVLKHKVVFQWIPAPAQLQKMWEHATA
jgi:hypothetical protein